MTPQEAIKNLKKLKSFHNGSYGTAIDMAIKALEQTRPKGKWKPLNYKDEMWGFVYKCSNCGAIEYGGDYCPNCGADMRGEEE